MLHADMVTDTKHERNADIASFKTNINFSLKNTYGIISTFDISAILIFLKILA